MTHLGAVRFPPSGDPKHATVLSSAAPCCRCLPSDSGIVRFRGCWCWGWGVGTRFFSGHLCVLSSSFSGGPRGGMHLFPLEWGVDQALPRGSPHSFSVACQSLVLRAAHANKCDCYCSVGHISLASFRSPDDLLLRLFSVDLVLRLGLNSVHFTSLMTHHGAVRFPPIRRSGARDDSLVSSALLSLLAF